MKTHPSLRCSIGDDLAGHSINGSAEKNFAGVHKLPVVFVINNNQWAISVPIKLLTATEALAQKAIAAGFPGEQADGNDVVAVRVAAEGAIERARRGGGPTSSRP